MLVTDARQAMKEEAPLERLRTLTGELQQVLQGLQTATGPGGGPQPGGPQPGGPQPGGPSEQRPDDDVIDADFTPG
jgi:molecular chaperone DnaK